MSTLNERNQKIINEFRANGGKAPSWSTTGTLLLLHTRGARTRETRVNPVAYVMDGDRYVIIASKGGAPAHPDWYHNLLAHPDVTIEVGAEKFPVHAAVVAELDRTRLYAKMVSVLPGFAEYEKKTSRKIPVIALTRA